MITLETEFESCVGGYAPNEPRLFTQLQRNEHAAIYRRSVKHTGRLEGFEVFAIKIEPKGKVQKFPNGVVKIVEDDTEKYPSNNQFGRIAWQMPSLGAATDKFKEITENAAQLEAEEDEEAKPVVTPIGEFTVGEFAVANGIEYPQASLIVKAALANGSVKFVREERRQAKGKMSKIYAKA